MLLGKAQQCSCIIHKIKSKLLRPQASSLAFPGHSLGVSSAQIVAFLWTHTPSIHQQTAHYPLKKYIRSRKQSKPLHEIRHSKLYCPKVFIEGHYWFKYFEQFLIECSSNSFIGIISNKPQRNSSHMWKFVYIHIFIPRFYN